MSPKLSPTQQRTEIMADIIECIFMLSAPFLITLGMMLFLYSFYINDDDQ